MEFSQPLVRACFLKREKRFFIHARLDDGRQVTAHTNNTGRMSGCLSPGAAIWLSRADNPQRKLKWTLELTETVADQTAGMTGGVLVGVNTALANRLVREALEKGILPGLAHYPEIQAEVRYGSRKSRVDFLLSGCSGQPQCWVEVKNVTLVNHGLARFPDAPSERGRKHLRELVDMVAQGDRAALVFCIQREDAHSVGPADHVDPAYGTLLRQAADAGVEIYGARCTVTPLEVAVTSLIPLKM